MGTSNKVYDTVREKEERRYRVVVVNLFFGVFLFFFILSSPGSIRVRYFARKRGEKSATCRCVAPSGLTATRNSPVSDVTEFSMMMLCVSVMTFCWICADGISGDKKRWGAEKVSHILIR